MFEKMLRWLRRTLNTYFESKGAHPAAIIRSGLKFMQARISFPAMILLWNKCSNLLKARLQRAWGRKRLPGVNESSGEPP